MMALRVPLKQKSLVGSFGTKTNAALEMKPLAFILLGKQLAHKRAERAPERAERAPAPEGSG